MDRLVLHGLGAGRELTDRDVEVPVHSTMFWWPGVSSVRPLCVEEPDAGRKTKHGKQTRVRQSLAQGILGVPWIVYHCGNARHEIILEECEHLLTECLGERSGPLPLG